MATTASSASASASMALKTWLLENKVLTVDPTDDLYALPTTPTPSGVDAPWRKDPHHFKKVKISAIALIKMVIHARSGGHLEVMGLMQGKVMGDTMVVLDAFALPVQGTETRVNAQQEAFEYMVQYQSNGSEMGRKEHVLGWYHSHPGYGCWLSGIDVSTQMTNQMYQEPFLAIVVDPNRTISAGRVEIGAFRTYPQNYTPPNAAPSEYQSIPLSKIEDFGVHANQYYSLDVSIFKSRLDSHLLELLWNKHWISTLSQSPLTTNKDYLIGQLADVAAKLDRADAQVLKSRQLGTSLPAPAVPVDSASAAADSKQSADKGVTLAKKGDTAKDAKENKATVDDSNLGKASRDAAKVVSEAAHSLMSQVLKHVVFNLPRAEALEAQPTQDARPASPMAMETD
ncbi:JAB1/Mov34/MPN/PAD-1 ubiquitin protease-domain-containing protein [Catenaria anguillulae PL171]|uniref:COP9 signalosome complex subunit 5 n=1 Tax=Catenaria anguillulae PL171 TaxID=765915 RepID=A0A1Y2HPM4_9FUNG|nr:JAB1/Mov34/MPN/PAD-1 ubiquitin protease-domain-containing protein [Catenaria anguillulae PL171]